MPFLLKKIFSALILPPTSLILLAFLGLLLSRKHPKTGKTLAALSLTTLLILSMPIAGNAMLHSLETAPPITRAQLKDIQAIVILGGGKNNNAPEYAGIDTTNKWTLERLRYGAHLQQLTGKPILVTAGAPYRGRPEADAMAESLQQDFHAKIVWVENQSKDTSENALNSAEILKAQGITNIALISQAWHLPRATAEFERLGLKVIPAPTGFTRDEPDKIANFLPSASGLNETSTALKEYLGKIFQIAQNCAQTLKRNTTQ